MKGSGQNDHFAQGQKKKKRPILGNAFVLLCFLLKIWWFKKKKGTFVFE